ncbi:hypothetical protein BT69DRAFT_369745 [Atractiella rhizophila]|nr:hypothetical protein BT69DRAFT_369745 [Atractiella rhizophila]
MYVKILELSALVTSVAHCPSWQICTLLRVFQVVIQFSALSPLPSAVFRHPLERMNRCTIISPVRCQDFWSMVSTGLIPESRARSNAYEKAHGLGGMYVISSSSKPVGILYLAIPRIQICGLFLATRMPAAAAGFISFTAHVRVEQS